MRVGHVIEKGHVLTWEPEKVRGEKRAEAADDGDELSHHVKRASFGLPLTSKYSSLPTTMSPVFNDKFDMLMNIKRQVPSTTESAPTEYVIYAVYHPTGTSSFHIQIYFKYKHICCCCFSNHEQRSPNTNHNLGTCYDIGSSNDDERISLDVHHAYDNFGSDHHFEHGFNHFGNSDIDQYSGFDYFEHVVVITTTATPTTPTTRATSTTITSASTSSTLYLCHYSFFQNTGAVVGVFVVVGIVAMILLVVIGTVFLRRRRAKQFDLDVQEAAREAARAQAPIEDDDDYTGTSYNTHNSKPMSAEQRAYGYGATNASGWDPYARGAAPGGYEMQHRRASVVTSTTPGMAGFGAGDTFAREQGYGQQQGYNQGYAQPYAQGNQGYAQQQGYAPEGYNTGYGQGYGQQAHNPSNTSSGYNNTSPQQGYALAQEQPGQGGRAPVHAQMMMPDPQRHSYNNVGAFRQSPSYGEAHPGEHVQYGHAEPEDTSGQDGRYPSAPRMSEDPYGGYLPYDEPGPSTTSQAPSSNPPAYATGPSNVGATGDRKVARQPSGKSHETRYSRDDDESDEEPTRRVLKVSLGVLSDVRRY
ncbi:transmembrane protein, putative [Rhizoctonia solani AG-3 Rhs1AP]|uniref:Transmembrane protein, putative n=1 Tax=Rhizoctonia solani AG-3 Rhs1AP TaxID=1086054 RepID=A0A0A1UHI3_9AGAM|nr:transmembrane protein, putative [Rhizoctonia solani AG-3 Rhs1AP]